jgi:hypothetical protein
MPAELTVSKILYDLVIAILTGIGTGLFVDYLIRQREQRHLLPARTLMYAEIMNLLKQFYQHTVAVRFLETSWVVLDFSEIASTLCPVEFKDPKILEFGSEVNRSFRAEIAQPLLGPNSDATHTKPIEAKGLGEANRLLDYLFERYGLVIEPELRTLLGKFHQELIQVLHFVDVVRDWNRDNCEQAFAEMLVNSFKAAEKIRLCVHSHAKSTDLNEYLSRPITPSRAG